MYNNSYSKKDLMTPLIKYYMQIVHKAFACDNGVNAHWIQLSAVI